MRIEPGEGYRVTLSPLHGGRTITVIMQGDVPAVLTTVTKQGRPYVVGRIERTTVYAVITMPPNPQPGMRPKARNKQSSTIGLDATRATKATRLTKDKRV
jgi:hypothetical protein